MTMPAAAVLDRADDTAVDDDRTAKPRRRSFSASYKLGILTEYESLTGPGSRGALLRREGLYSSHIVEWRKARDAGALKELGRTSGRRPTRSPEQVALEKAQAKIARLEDQLTKHRLALEIQGKASELLERLLAESSQHPRRQP